MTFALPATMHSRQPFDFSYSNPNSNLNPAVHASSRHTHPHVQPQFQSSPQVLPPLQQQPITSSPFGGWPVGPTSSSPMPPPPQAAPTSFSNQHRALSHSQVLQPPSVSSFHQPPSLPPPLASQMPQAFPYPVYPYPAYVQQPPEHNEIEMNKEMVLQVLDKFSEELPRYFDLEDSGNATHNGGGSSGDERTKRRRRDGDTSRSKPRAIRLTVHGGACMLLHPGFHALSLKMSEIPHLSSTRPSPPDGSRRNSDPTYVGPRPTTTMHHLARRTSTRDIDVLLRGFVADYATLGPPPWTKTEEDLSRMDAATRLKACIKATTRHFPGLGADWMNADADVSLPMAADPTTHQTYDPIHTATWTQKNTHLYTIYTSPNKRLVLASVPPYWLLALKLSRWGPRDWADVGIVLRYGTLISRSLFHQDIEWSAESLRRFLEKECWAMGYAGYDVGKKGTLISRCEQAASLVKGWEDGVPDGWPGRYLDRSLLEGTAEPSIEAPVGDGGSVALPPAPTAAPPLVPYQEYRENVRDWARRSRSQKRRSSSSRRRSRSKSRWRRKEEEEEEMLRRDGPFVPPNVEFDQDGYVLANVRREEEEDRRGRSRSQREHDRQQAYAAPYAGYAHPSHPSHPQQAPASTLTRNVGEHFDSSWITDSMARARISSPIQDINRAGPVDPSLASQAWHPRARAAAINGVGGPSGSDAYSSANTMGLTTNLGVLRSNSPYRHQSSPYNGQRDQAGTSQLDRTRERSVIQPDPNTNHSQEHEYGWGHQLLGGHAVPEPDHEDGSEEEEDEESDSESGGRPDESESDGSESDKENRGRGMPFLNQRHRQHQGRRTHQIYAPPTPHPAAVPGPISRGGSSQSGVEGSLLLQPPSRSHLPLGSISGRTASRSLSPKPPKHRPPPLNISPPPSPQPEVLPGFLQNSGAKESRNNFYSSSSTNVHPAYFGGAYDSGHRRGLDPPNPRIQHRSQPRRPSPNPPNLSHSTFSQPPPHAQPPLPPHRVHVRQPLTEAHPEPPSRRTREARAAQHQFEEQLRDWEQEQRWRRGIRMA